MGRHSSWDYPVGKKLPSKLKDPLHISKVERLLTSKAVREQEGKIGGKMIIKNRKQRRLADEG